MLDNPAIVEAAVDIFFQLDWIFDFLLFLFLFDDRLRFDFAIFLFLAITYQTNAYYINTIKYLFFLSFGATFSFF